MDTRDTRVQNLLFLLSAAPIGLGCVISGDDTDTDTNASANATTTTGTPNTDSTEGTTETPPGETTVGPATTDDGQTTEAPADTTEGAETTAGVVIPEFCATYGDAVGMCFTPEDGEYAAEVCASGLAYYETYGAECVTAYEDFIACLSALSCEDLMLPSDQVCVEQQTAVDTACAAK